MENKPQPTNILLSLFFGIIFTGVGIGCSAALYKEYVKDSPDFILAGFLSFIVVIFGGLGVLALYGVIASFFKRAAVPSSSAMLSRLQAESEADKLTKRFGGTLHNTASNKTVLMSGNASLMYAAWFGVIFLSLMALPLSAFVYKSVVIKQNNPPLSVYIFALAIIALFVIAVRCTIRWRKFGQSIVEFEGKELILGQTVRATLKSTQEVQGAGDLTIDLKGVYTKVTGSGKNRRQDSITVASSKIKIPTRSVRFKMGVPFTLTIPSSLTGIDHTPNSKLIRWTLTATAPTSGVDYSADFVVPVILPEQSSGQSDPDYEDEVDSDMTDKQNE